MLSRALARNDPFETMVCVVSGKNQGATGYFAGITDIQKAMAA